MKRCPKCGTINEVIMLSDRIPACGCGYAGDWDVKDVKTLLLAGGHELSCTLAEHPGKGKSSEAPSSSAS